LSTFGTGGAFNLSQPQVSNPFAQLQAFQGLGMSLSAQPAGLEIDFAVDLDPNQLTPEQWAALGQGGPPTKVLESVPRRAFGVLAIGNFKDAVQGALGQARQNPLVGGFIQKLGLNEVVKSLSGDAALEVSPGSLGPVSGALLVGTKDPAAMAQFLDNLAIELAPPALRGPPATPPFDSEDYKGVTIHFRTEPVPGQPDVVPAYAVANGFGIVASSPDEVKAIIDAQEGSNIAGSQAFRDARDQIPEGSQLLFVDTQALLQKFGPQLEQSIGGTFTSLVEPNLRPVKALIVTSGQHGDAVVSRLFLLIR